MASISFTLAAGEHMGYHSWRNLSHDEQQKLRRPSFGSQMNDTNPYEGPTADEATEQAKPLKTSRNQSKPLPSSGRLDVMGIGDIVSIAGIVLRDFPGLARRMASCAADSQFLSLVLS